MQGENLCASFYAGVTCVGEGGIIPAQVIYTPVEPYMVPKLFFQTAKKHKKAFNTNFKSSLKQKKTFEVNQVMLVTSKAT